MTEPRVLKMFGCDTARLAKYPGRIYLILGWRRHTKDSDGQWFKNGEPYDFAYTEEKVVASGANMRELMKSAREYKRLCGMPWERFMREYTIQDGCG